LSATNYEFVSILEFMGY